jgi:hypothetical protein
MKVDIAKFESEPLGSFHVLDQEKAERMSAKTLYLPSPLDVAKAILAIPSGQTKTINDLRETIAKAHNADTSCPAKVLKYWKWMAQFSDENPTANSPYHIPWWRVLKDNKPSRHMPGGIENQLKKLSQEK